MKKPWVLIRVLHMDPNILGVIGPGFLNQVPTLLPRRSHCFLQVFSRYFLPGVANENPEDRTPKASNTKARPAKPKTGTMSQSSSLRMAFFSGRLRIPVLRKLRQLLLQVLDVARDLRSLIVGRPKNVSSSLSFSDSRHVHALRVMWVTQGFRHLQLGRSRGSLAIPFECVIKLQRQFGLCRELHSAGLCDLKRDT